MFLSDQKRIEKIMNDNRAKSIEDNNVVERVKKVTKKYLEEDKTIEQIAIELGINFWIVYRDLKIRLPLLNNELYKLVEEKKNERINDNLNKKI